MAKSLLLGCGNSRDKKIQYPGAEWLGELTTLDMNPNCGADVVHDLDVSPAYLPFPDEEFDELAAYDVLEHIGLQGDWRSWFDEMADYHRILKPGGIFGIIVPVNADALADPGHTRFITANYFLFLSQKFYDKALADGLPVTDYRWYWKLDFEIPLMQPIDDHHLAVVLRKPEAADDE